MPVVSAAFASVDLDIDRRQEKIQAPYNRPNQDEQCYRRQSKHPIGFWLQTDQRPAPYVGKQLEK